MSRPVCWVPSLTRYAGLLALAVTHGSCGGPPGEGARIVEIPRVNRIEIATGETIQLIGVDEITFPDQAGVMIDQAVRFTRRRLAGKMIFVKRHQPLPGGGDKILGEVCLGNDLFNAEVIREGYGKVAENVPEELKSQFQELEEAREEKRGL